MTVLSASKQRPVRLPADGLTTAELKLAGYTNFGAGSLAHTVYKGSVVVCDVSDTDGYFRACPASSSVNAASGDIFGGIAAEQIAVGSADAADGSKLLTVYRNGVWGFAKGSVAITDIGAAAYASDDDTITTTSTNNFFIGDIVDVDGTYVWVDISRAFMRPTSAA
jgi:hypothetical protein